MSEHDPVTDSLEDLLASIQRIDELAREATERAERRRAERERGRPYREILPEERPLVFDLVLEMIGSLTDAGGRFRTAQARALYEEGATMDQIADLFGVSRQRVSTLLARARARVADPSDPGDSEE